MIPSEMGCYLHRFMYSFYGKTNLKLNFLSELDPLCIFFVTNPN